MPLIHSKSKKAMSENIKTEMEAGKPQNQSIAIAYSVKRKAAKKKMAKGGEVSYKNDSAITESRPMPSERDNDRVEVEHNSAVKPPKNDQWTDSPTVAQAQKPSKTGLKSPQPLKMAKMTESKAPFSVRTRGTDEDEASMETRMSPEPNAHTKSSDHEANEKKQGSSPDMSDEHSTKRKPYARGGTVQYRNAMDNEYESPDEQPARLAKGGEVEDSDYDANPNSYMDDLTDLPPSEDEGSSMADSENEDGSNRQGPEVPDMEDEHTTGRKPYFKGGSIHRDMMLQPQDEVEEEMHNSLADAIMAKRAKEASSMSGDPDYPVKSAYGGMYARGGEIMEDADDIMSRNSMETTDADQVDLRRNTQEDANMEDKASFDALRKENYSSDYMDVDQPEDSNEDSDDSEMNSHDKYDMVDTIRRRMNSRRQR